MLKRVVLVAGLLIGLTPALSAQDSKFRVTGLFGYTLSDGVDGGSVTLGGNVYNTACATGFTPTFTSSAITNTTTGTVTVNFTAPTAGTYYVTVNYGSASVKKKAVPAPTAVPYTFSTTGVASSSMPLSLHQ